MKRAAAHIFEFFSTGFIKQAVIVRIAAGPGPCGKSAQSSPESPPEQKLRINVLPPRGCVVLHRSDYIAVTHCDGRAPTIVSTFGYKEERWMDLRSAICMERISYIWKEPKKIKIDKRWLYSYLNIKKSPL